MENKKHKVLSVRNPYAYFIVKGIKDIENRTWQTKHRGKLLIHASGPSIFDYENECLPDDITMEFEQSLKDAGKEGEPLSDTANEILKIDSIASKFEHHGNPYYKSGLIIGQVTIVDCIKDSDSIWAMDDHYHWILKDAVMFDVGIKARGKLGLWNWEKDLVSC